MHNFSVGQYVLILSLFKICKVKSISVRGSAYTLYVDINKTEVGFSGLSFSSEFNNRNLGSSRIYSISQFINFIGFISAIILIICYFNL